MTCCIEVQTKCFKELEEKVGDRKVELKDRAHLTFMQATICEIQRIANILPINLLRTCTENFKIDGFYYAAGTMVLPQVSIALNNPDNFEDPKQFRPERFIDENSNLRKYDSFLPFSIGKRQCLGESLAKAELFLIFTNLIRSFEFSKESPTTELCLKRVYGLTVSPRPFVCKIRKRHNCI